MARLVLLAALCTFALGFVLRAALAGAELAPLGEFADLRHAHSHLGVYGVLFPAFLLVAREAGLTEPKRSILRAYALAVAVAVIGFAIEGYGLVSIAASTCVLAVWLLTAFLQRRPRTKGWLASTAVALFVASLLVPLIALSPRLWPQLAQPLARTFTSLLMLGVFVPAALHRLDARAYPSWATLPVAIAAAFALGLDPSPLLLPFVVVAGVALVVSGGGARTDLELRVAFALVGAGLVAYGTRLVPPTHAMAVAGVHALVLGPLLSTFAPRRIPRPVRIVWLALVAAMTLALVIGDLAPRIAPSAESTGVVVALVAGALVSVAAWIVLLLARSPCPTR